MSLGLAVLVGAGPATTAAPARTATESVAGPAITKVYISPRALPHAARRLSRPAVAASPRTTLAPRATIRAVPGDRRQVGREQPGALGEPANLRGPQWLSGQAASAATMPKPASWTMMMIGFGLVGFFGRGRRRSHLRDHRLEAMRARPQGVARSVVS